MILSTKYYFTEKVFTIAPEGEVQSSRPHTVHYFPMEGVKRAIIEAARNAGAIPANTPDDGGHRFEYSMVRPGPLDDLTIRVQQSFGVSCDLRFELRDREQYAVASPLSNYGLMNDGTAAQPARLTTGILTTSLSVSGTGHSPAAARTMANLITEMCNLADLITTQFDGKVGLLEDPNEVAATATEEKGN